MNSTTTFAYGEAQLSALEVSVGNPAVRKADDWGWTATYDASVFAPMTGAEMLEEDWAV